MQRVEIIGYLGQDAVVKDLGQNQVINFSVAVSESYVNKTTNEKTTTTTWFECAKWGNNTQISQYLRKGTQVFVSGKPIARSWQKEDGTLVSVLGINVLNVTLLGGAKTDVNTEPHNANQAQPQEYQSPATDFNSDDDELLF